MIRTKISASQMLTLLFLCRMFSLLTITPAASSAGGEIGGGMAVLAALCSFGFQLLLFLPGWLLMRRHAGQNLAEALAEELGGVGQAAAFFLWLLLAALAGLSAVEFEDFLVTAVYERAPRLLFAVLFLAVAIYGSWLGLEAFARYACFGCTLFLLLLLSLTAALAGDFRVSELFAELPPHAGRFWQTAWSFTSGNLEILCFLLLLPNIRGGKKENDAPGPVGKGVFLGWSGLYTLAAAGLLLLLTGVMGGSGRQSRPYPFYTLAMAAEGTLLARMDAVHMSVWSVLGLLRCCLLLYSAGIALRCAIPLRREGRLRLWMTEHRGCMTGGMAVLSMLLVSRPAVLELVRPALRGGAALLVALWALPFLALFAGRLRSCRKSKGEADTGKGERL